MIKHFICAVLLVVLGSELGAKSLLIQNDRTRITFAPEFNYSVIGLLDNESGTDAVSPQAIGKNSHLWSIVFQLPRGGVTELTAASPCHRVRVEQFKNNKLKLTWIGVKIEETDERISVEVRMSLLPNGVTEWSMRVFGSTVAVPSQIDFPRLEGLALKDENYAFFPLGAGRLKRFALGTPAFKYEAEYPCPCSMQFMGICGAPANNAELSNGTLYCIEDGGGCRKTLLLAKNEDNIILSSRHFPEVMKPNTPRDEVPKIDYSLPYAINIQNFNGDARSAASIYSDWASRQKWSAESSQNKAQVQWFSADNVSFDTLWTLGKILPGAGRQTAICFAAKDVRGISSRKFAGIAKAARRMNASAYVSMDLGEEWLGELRKEGFMYLLELGADGIVASYPNVLNVAKKAVELREYHSSVRAQAPNVHFMSGTISEILLGCHDGIAVTDKMQPEDAFPLFNIVYGSRIACLENVNAPGHAQSKDGSSSEEQEHLPGTSWKWCGDNGEAELESAQVLACDDAVVRCDYIAKSAKISGKPSKKLLFNIQLNIQNAKSVTVFRGDLEYFSCSIESSEQSFPRIYCPLKGAYSYAICQNGASIANGIVPNTELINQALADFERKNGSSKKITIMLGYAAMSKQVCDDVIRISKSQKIECYKFSLALKAGQTMLNRAKLSRLSTEARTWFEASVNCPQLFSFNSPGTIIINSISSLLLPQIGYLEEEPGTPLMDDYIIQPSVPKKITLTSRDEWSTSIFAIGMDKAILSADNTDANKAQYTLTLNDAGGSRLFIPVGAWSSLHSPSKGNFCYPFLFQLEIER